MDNRLKEARTALAETISATTANYYTVCSQIAFAAVNHFVFISFWSTLRCLDMAEAGLRSFGSRR
ncbi:MAG TPA: hypothetical protein P5089_02850 [Candidatus Portnoybacteria bacterium]|nr:hypothetical protein [Candidatus Portnoybacteria bacterium]